MTRSTTATDATVLPFPTQRGSHCRPNPPTGAGAGNPVVTRFRVPLNAELTAEDRHYIRLVDEAEQRIAPVRPTTVERKLHEARARHYIRMGREVHRPSRGERITTIACIAIVVWIVTIFAAAYVSAWGAGL